MLKRIIIVFAILICSVLLVSCSSNSKDRSNESNSNSNSNTYTENRKIIYNASISVSSDDLNKTTNELKVLLVEDDWVENEKTTETSNYITFRIKTSRLTPFIDSIKSNYKTSNYSLEAKDISLDYIDLSTKITALKAEEARLIELYDNASVNDMIMINQRLSAIEAELIKLQGSLNVLDDLVEYSVVKVWIYGPKESANPPKIGSNLGNAFSTGWNAVLSIIDFILSAIVFFIPFLLLTVPLAGIVVLTMHLNKKKKAKKSNK